MRRRGSAPSAPRTAARTAQPGPRRRLRLRRRPPDRARRGRAARRVAPASATAGSPARILVPAALVGGVAVLPLVLPTEEQVELVALAAVFACVGLSVRILLGHLGALSLGHQGFVALGALAGGVLTGHPALDLPFALGVVGAVAVGSLVGVVGGYPAQRAGGIHLPVATLAFGVVVARLIDGSGGWLPAVAVARPAGFTGARAFAFLCLLALVVCAFLDWRLERTKAGRALRAIRDDPALAASYGIDVPALRVLALGLSGGMAAAAGALLGALHGSAGGQGEAALPLGLLFAAMVVVGGPGHRVGVVVTSALLALAGAALEALVEAGPLRGAGTAPLAVLAGLLLLVVLRGYPAGVGGLLRPVGRWVRGGRLRERPPTAAGGARDGRP